MAAKTATAAFDAAARRRQTVALELAAALHHRCGGGAREEGTEDSQRGPAEYFELSSDEGRPASGKRPATLLEPWPQGQVQRHTVVHIVDVSPFGQILDVPNAADGGPTGGTHEDA